MKKLFALGFALLSHAPLAHADCVSDEITRLSQENLKINLEIRYFSMELQDMTAQVDKAAQQSILESMDQLRADRKENTDEIALLQEKGEAECSK